jgi:uncharacterized protein (TIGR03086 family)
MTSFPDLTHTATRLAALVYGVADDQLSNPTPCDKWLLGDLLDHVGGFAIGFGNAARKGFGEIADATPEGNAANLEAGWRDRIAGDLQALAISWADPQAWTGMTRVGSVDLPGENAGMFALDELVVHGWDVARASRQPYDCDRTSLEAVHALVLGFAGPEQAQQRSSIFGPVLEVDLADPLLDRVIGLTGRHPAW